jgi:hypothetical protein
MDLIGVWCLNVFRISDAPPFMACTLNGISYEKKNMNEYKYD